MKPLAYGIYDALIDEELADLLDNNPELRTVLEKIDPEEQPGRYASFIARVLEGALRLETSPERRLALCNKLLSNISKTPGLCHLDKHQLSSCAKPILAEVTPPNFVSSGLPRPHTPIAESSLFTGSPQEPQLAHELIKEMATADGVDILVSFIK